MPAGQPEAPNDPSIDSTNALKILDSGLPTSRIIESTKAFDVAMSFTFGGTSVAPGVVATPLTFTVSYYYTELGATVAGALGTVTGTTQAGVMTYDDTGAAGSTTTLSVPASTLAVGVYRLTAVVNFTSPGGAAQGYYAFTDGPVIEIV